jgi:hypothetical protein
MTMRRKALDQEEYPCWDHLLQALPQMQTPLMIIQILNQMERTRAMDQAKIKMQLFQLLLLLLLLVE